MILINSPPLPCIWEGYNMQQKGIVQTAKRSNARRRILMSAENGAQRWEEHSHWGLDKAPGTEIMAGRGGAVLYSILSVTWSCLSHSLSREHVSSLPFSPSTSFLSCKAHLRSLHFLTTSSPHRFLLQPCVWPSLGTEDNQPSRVGCLSLHIWLLLRDC